MYAVFFWNKGQPSMVRPCTLTEGHALEKDLNVGLWVMYTEPEDFVHYEVMERTTNGWITVPPPQPQQQLLN